MLADAGYLDSVHRNMAISAYVLPSQDDADLLFPGQDFAAWSMRLLRGKARAVVLKRGDQGCLGRDQTATHELAALKTEVIDPTGAGDCFCGTLVPLLAAGCPLPAALARANAAGALAVARLGPMEGNASLAEIDARIAGVKG